MPGGDRSRCYRRSILARRRLGASLAENVNRVWACGARSPVLIVSIFITGDVSFVKTVIVR